MTERYSFAVDRHLVPNISVDNGVVWSQDTLTDTITEDYASAEEETQYLSVLDSTSEISLETLNITLTNPKLEVEENAEAFINTEEIMEQTPEEGNEQVVVYSIEGSDELYGIQLAQDEDGNLQKYQFQFRKNKDGQLEAIPETIQLLSMDEDVQDGNVPDNPEQQQQEETVLEENAAMQHSMHIFVQEDNSGEHILPDRNALGEQEEDDSVQEDTEVYDNEHIEDIDIKPGILTLHNVKQELQEHQQEAPPLEDETTDSYPEDPYTQFEQEANLGNNEEANEEALIEYNERIDQDSVASEENSINSEPINDVNHQTSEHFEQIEVNPDLHVDQDEENPQEVNDDYATENNMNDSDLEDDNYHIVEGVHITGDVEAANELPSSDEPIDDGEKVVTAAAANNNNANILRHALKINKEPRSKKDHRLYLYVVQHPEKENVDSLSMDLANLCKPMKANPRSILKSSFQARNESTFLSHSEQLSKRFAKCKEAVQARIFHNFINKTTIPQAPVRKDRLPRKQTIKPVERMDEEIVVQEVMVSKNGFVEAVGKGFNKENLAVTEYVELTDSDDDYDPKRGTNSRKKKKQKRKKIEITISDESDVSSVIELDESDDEEQENKDQQEVSKSPEEETTPTKRRRGRPPKNRSVTDTAAISQSDSSESPSKKARSNEPSTTTTTATTTNPEKPEIPCPKCDKTFPSQNSLKTHLQHHNLQSSLRRNAAVAAAANTICIPPDLKYKCDQCGSSFKYNVLLKRHTCDKTVTCSVCKKKFKDQASLTVHRRIHAKEHLLKATTLPPSSPKKSSNGSPSFKVPKKISSLKCKTCGKLCSSLQNLNVHSKTHKEYPCATCSSKFLSKIALEKHVRENCVKSPQNAAARRLTRSTVKGNQEVVKCDKCTAQFESTVALSKHQAAKHAAETPKGSPRKLYRESRAHSGVPATRKLRNAYTGLKSQLLKFDQ